MPISDEEAYKQGKRIAEAMLRGTYSPSNDYSDKGYYASDAGPSESGSKGLLIVLGFVLALVLISLVSR